MNKMRSFMLFFFMLVLTSTVECEKRCDIRRIFGCMKPKNTDKNDRGAQVKYMYLYFVSLLIQIRT